MDDLFELIVGAIFVGIWKLLVGIWKLLKWFWRTACWLVMWIYHKTPRGKLALMKELLAKKRAEEQGRQEAEERRKQAEERRKQAEERCRRAEQERKNAEELRLLNEAKQAKMKELQFCKALWKLDYDTIIVDTNVFMNAAEDTMSNHDAFVLATYFFSVIRKLHLKIHILTSQLNEISNMRRSNKGDNEKKIKARRAVKLMLELQNEGLLDGVGDENDKKVYADPEIVRATRRLLKEGHHPLVITDDFDLSLRIGFKGTGLRKTLKEMYELCADNAVRLRGVHCGLKYVCMDKKHGGVLMANRDRADLWETFSLFVDGRGNYTLQSKANNKFVCADPTQGGRLVAREAASPDDQTAFEFELVPVAGKKSCIALKSKATGKFVSVRENEGNVLIANAPEVSDWEILEIC